MVSLVKIINTSIENMELITPLFIQQQILNTRARQKQDLPFILQQLRDNLKQEFTIQVKEQKEEQKQEVKQQPKVKSEKEQIDEELTTVEVNVDCGFTASFVVSCQEPLTHLIDLLKTRYGKDFKGYSLYHQNMSINLAKRVKDLKLKENPMVSLTFENKESYNYKMKFLKFQKKELKSQHEGRVDQFSRVMKYLTVQEEAYLEEEKVDTALTFFELGNPNALEVKTKSKSWKGQVCLEEYQGNKKVIVQATSQSLFNDIKTELCRMLSIEGSVVYLFDTDLLPLQEEVSLIQEEVKPNAIILFSFIRPLLLLNIKSVLGEMIQIHLPNNSSVKELRDKLVQEDKALKSAQFALVFQYTYLRDHNSLKFHGVGNTSVLEVKEKIKLRFVVESSGQSFILLASPFEKGRQLKQKLRAQLSLNKKDICIFADGSELKLNQTLIEQNIKENYQLSILEIEASQLISCKLITGGNWISSLFKKNIDVEVIHEENMSVHSFKEALVATTKVESMKGLEIKVDGNVIGGQRLLGPVLENSKTIEARTNAPTTQATLTFKTFLGTFTQKVSVKEEMLHIIEKQKQALIQEIAAGCNQFKLVISLNGKTISPTQLEFIEDEFMDDLVEIKYCSNLAILLPNYNMFKLVDADVGRTVQDLLNEIPDIQQFAHQEKQVMFEGKAIDLKARLYQSGSPRRLYNLTLQINFPESLGEQIYIHQDRQLCDDFMAIIASLQPDLYTKEKIFQEFKQLNLFQTQKDATLTQKFNDETIFKASLFAYTMNSYKELNQVLGLRKWASLSNYLASIIIPLPKNQHHALTNPLKVLHRGCESIPTDAYEVGERFFFSQFTSTSLNLDRAKKFAGNAGGGVLFKIIVGKNSPYHNLKIYEIGSRYVNEEEVLLLPFFHFQVMKKYKLQRYMVIELQEIAHQNLLDLNRLTCTKIVWIDGNIGNQENQGYLNMLIQKFPSINCCGGLQQALPLIRRAIKCTVIISGALGQQEIENIEKLEMVGAVIVFCYNLEKHLKWAQEHPIVKAVVNEQQQLEKELTKHFTFFPTLD